MNCEQCDKELGKNPLSHKCNATGAEFILCNKHYSNHKESYHDGENVSRRSPYFNKKELENVKRQEDWVLVYASLKSDIKVPPFESSPYCQLINYFRRNLSTEEIQEINKIILSKIEEGFVERHIGSALHRILNPEGLRKLAEFKKHYEKIVWDHGYNNDASIYEIANNYFDDLD